VSATFNVTANTSLGSVSGSGSASGPLASTPTGTIAVDWGSPGWNSQIDVPAGGAPISNPNPGSAAGAATLNLFSFIPLNFNLSVNVDTIDLNLASSYSSPTSPLDPGTPGAGPWTSGDLVDIALSAQVDFMAQGTGFVSFIAFGAANQAIGPAVVSGIPVLGALERLGGNPGTGSRITLPIAGLTLALGAQPPGTFNTPGCEVPLGPFCTFNVNSVTVQLTSLTLSNITGTIVADQNLQAIAPEPATALLIALGLAGLARRARRR
jgi:hypothetical protein